ncbi:tetratricopeptide repeat protein [Halodesulfovibrio marinisediminis]|uniref:OmpA family protein n=1 Tax=Halodesulfovibrio marinisediminis DSM 17456 TaxID=1121457 RepID=A0A1N6E8K0_9BACT|nr:tetratricopeptide repeat protein [Halodesulfovibrio marinisediminis]SIN79350.1 OmpA family protein [Halodesulfovibrio marinisediminis DSM 17456]
MNVSNVVCRLLMIGTLVVAMAGCTGVKGQYYLGMEKYGQGQKDFEQAVAKNPNDAMAHYYLGRMLLAQDKPEAALKHLKKAVKLQPNDDDYHFWLGINYWSVMDYKNERKQYLRAIELNPHATYAHLYLGHNYLDKREWKKAYDQYQIVLRKDQYDPEALYNTAAALHGMKRYKREHKALLKYLKYYPDGHLALKAVTSLNKLGDYSWRNFYIGKRKVSFVTVKFEKDTAKIKTETTASLKLLGAMLKNSPKLSVDVVVYVKGNKSLAKARAIAVRNYITTYVPDVERKQLPISWFGQSERIGSGKKAQHLPESVRFITHVK